MADLTVLGAPDLTQDQFARILQGTPAAGESGAMYRALLAGGVKPGPFLGFFWVESKFGTAGICAKYQTRNPGNVRSPQLVGVPGVAIVDTPRGKFAKYPTWEAGTADWAARLAGPKYAGRGLLTLSQILPVYAPASDSNDPAQYAAQVAAKVAEWTKGATQVAPRICLAAGHHNTDGGNAYEIEQTGYLTEATAAHCRRLGFDVVVLTPDGPDANRDPGDGMYPGGIWDVALAAAALKPPPDIFLELHTEGGGTTGVFAIYPDWGGDVDGDVRDKLGPLVSARIAAATGLGLRRAGRDGKPGVCSEKETGVGLRGYRLGIFNKSAALAATTSRLIIEYGAHDKEPDLSIVKRPGFYDAAGRATAEAFAAFLGWQIPASAEGATKQPIGQEQPNPSALKLTVPGRGEFWIVEPVLNYWRSCGGVFDHPNALGYPVTGMYQEGGALIQWFDRGRVEVRDGKASSALVGLELAGLRNPAAR